MRRRRPVVAVDRMILSVLGLLLVLVGSSGLAGAAGLIELPGTRHGEISLGTAVDAPDAPWWPGAAAGAAALLVLLGLWWVLAHRPGARTTTIALPGSQTGDRLRVAPDAVAGAAAAAVETDPQVRSATLALRSERGTLVLVGRLRTAPRADLVSLGEAVDRAASQVGTVLGRDVTGRIRLAVARRGIAERAPE